jgi:hypothetical protein
MTVHLSTVVQSDRTEVMDIEAGAVVLPTGQVLLLLSGSGTSVPETGQFQTAGEAFAWQAWLFGAGPGKDGAWSAIALVDTLPRGDALLFAPSRDDVWKITVGLRVGVSASDLIDRARAIGADMATLFRYLVSLLERCRQTAMPKEKAFRAFVQDFLEAVAVHDGFIELLAVPETRGLLLQGWCQSFDATPLRWISLADPLVQPDMAVAFFDRPDLLSPARGVCLFHKDLCLPETSAGMKGYFEHGGRLLRLDLVPEPPPVLIGDAATEHVALMIPRLNGPSGVLAPFKRICRPLFKGDDTLTSTRLPLAIGLDLVLRAPDGALLMVGWLLDPDALTEMVLVKSRTNRYARISEHWVRLSRPDLARAFGDDPRFAGRIGAKDTMAGFIVRVPPGPDPHSVDEELYLEVVLGNQRALFRPLQLTMPYSRESLRQLLAGLSPSEPELARIIDDHLVPMLSCIEHPLPNQRRAAQPSLIPIGCPRPPADVVVLMCFTTLDELQPVFALLAGTPEARSLDLTLIAPRRVVEEVLEQLQHAFQFYELTGHVLAASSPGLQISLLDSAVQSATAGHVLLWSPKALPKAPGWLARLLCELKGMGRPGMISPLLTYEDGSIRFGPSGDGPASALGFASDRLQRRGTTEVQTSAAEIALMSRDHLRQAGGFAGHLFSDAFAHIDLSMRVASAGGAIWCSGDVAFWCLDDAASPDGGAPERILRQVDARLLVKRGASDLTEWFR